MADEAIKNNSKERIEDPQTAESSAASEKFLAELNYDPSISKPGSIDGTVFYPRHPVPDCFPPIDNFPPIGKPPGDKPNYIPSPGDIAPIMLPGFFENYPKSPELDKVGLAADKLAQLMKTNANPEEQQKAWEEFESSAKHVPGNLAALRLNLSLFQGEVPGALSAKYDSYNGKLSLIDYGTYQSMGKFDYKNPETVAWNADKNPDVIKASSEFAERLQKGVTSDELKQLLPELLDKLAAAGMDSSSATSAIYHALTHAPNSKYDSLGISREPSYMVDGKPVRIHANALIFDKEVTLGITPEPKKVFG